LRDNLDKENTVTGLKIKMYAGYIFSTLVWNDMLKSEIKNISAHFSPELNDEKFNRLAEISQMEIPANCANCKEVITSLQEQLSITEKEAGVLLLALATSHSPAQINDAVIETVLKHIEPSAIVEIIVWLSVLQLLNRLSSYYSLTKSY
jgi:alkylhydroperoxidase family enzyme